MLHVSITIPWLAVSWAQGTAGQVERACATRNARRVGLALEVAALRLAGALGVGVYFQRFLHCVV